ncbi:MAG: RNA polymerase sigma factor [Anaerolineae bacterium]
MNIDDNTKRLPWEAYREIARNLLQDYRWSLLSVDALARLIRDGAPGSSSEDTLRRQAKHQYAIALYKACRQSNDPERRERAYRDLHHYLYRAAYNRWPELAEDATQRALLLVYEQIDRCQEPGTFLAFALWKLRHAFQQEQRARRILQDDEALIVEMGRSRPLHTSPPSGNQKLHREEQTTLLVNALQSITDPRKRQAITLKYLADWSDEEIAARLEVSVSYVRVLRHRGMERLRQDRRLRRYFDIKKDENL